MKILGLSGGFKNGNNDGVCKEALLGAKNAGAEIEFVNLNDLSILHCTGCKACVKSIFSGKGGKCVLKDDFEWLLDKMLDADGVIFSIPIFEKGASGLFRTITDRFGPRLDKGNVIIGTKIAEHTGGTAPDPRNLKEKAVAYIGVGGSDWTTRIQCDFINHALTPMWKIIDTQVFPWSLSIIGEDDKLARANEIGKNIAQAAENLELATYKGKPGLCSHCNCNNFHITEEGKALCCACGIQGELELKDGKYSFTYDEEQLVHAHDTLTGKFEHGDDIKENEGKSMELKATDKYKAKQEFYKSFISATKPS